MQTVTGLCKFCGQRMIVEIDEDVPKGQMQEAADEEATLGCSCKQGRAYRDEQVTLTQCAGNIADMFAEKYPEIANALTVGMNHIWSQKIKRITCTTEDGGVAAIYRSKGDLVVKWTKKQEIELSTGY